MTTPRKPTVPTTDTIDAFCAQFDALLNRRAARQAFRQYLIGLLLPREETGAPRGTCPATSLPRRGPLPAVMPV